MNPHAGLFAYCNFSFACLLFCMFYCFATDIGELKMYILAVSYRLTDPEVSALVTDSATGDLQAGNSGAQMH